MATATREFKSSFVTDTRSFDQGTKKISAGLKGVDKTAQQTSKRFDGVKSSLGGVGTALKGLAVASVLGSVVKAAAEDEAGMKRLEVTIKNVTGATDEQVAANEDFISGLSKASGVADDQMRPAMENLVRATGSVTKAQELLSVALDVSQGTGKDLATVSVAIAKAQNGNIAALGRLGIKVRDASGATQDFNTVLGTLKEQFGGQAAAQADTFAGTMARLQVAVAEAAEDIGKSLGPALQGLSGIATGLAAAFDKIPGPVKQAAAALALAAVAGRLLGPRLATAATGLSSFVKAAKGAGAISGVGAGLRGITGALGGPWGIAIATGIGLLTAFASSNAKTKRDVDELSEGIDAQTKALTDSGKATLAKQVADKNMGDDLRTVGASMRDVTDAVTGSDAQFNAFRARLRTVVLAVNEQSKAAQSLVSDIDSLRSNYTDAQEVAANLAASQKAVNTALSSDAPVASAEAIADLRDAYDEANGTLEDLIGNLDVLNGEFVSTQKAVIDYQEALDKGTASAKENGKTLSTNTEAGRNNREALIGMAEAAAAEVEARLRQGESVSSVTGTYARHRAELVLVAQRMGLSKTAAQRYVDQLLLTPKELDTKVKTTGLAGAQQDVTVYAGQLAGIPATVTTKVDLRLTDQARRSIKELDRLENRSGTFVIPVGPGLTSRAGGGALGKGQVSWVGERGAELFVPGVSGYVLAAGAVQRLLTRAGQGSAPSSSITINFGAGVNTVEAGREVVRAIRAYERSAGPGWRS